MVIVIHSDVKGSGLGDIGVIWVGNSWGYDL